MEGRGDAEGKANLADGRARPSVKAGEGCRENRTRRSRREGEAQAEVAGLICREKPLTGETPAPVPQTDTGGQVEDTKVNGKTFVKELGKLTP